MKVLPARGTRAAGFAQFVRAASIVVCVVAFAGCSPFDNDGDTPRETRESLQRYLDAVEEIERRSETLATRTDSLGYEQKSAAEWRKVVEEFLDLAVEAESVTAPRSLRWRHGAYVRSVELLASIATYGFHYAEIPDDEATADDERTFDTNTDILVRRARELRIAWRTTVLTYAERIGLSAPTWVRRVAVPG